MKRQVSVAIWLASVTVAVSAQARSRSRRPPLSSIPRVSLYRLSKPLPREPRGLHGDPAQPGMFVSRMEIPPNTKTRPHYNDQDQIVTVLKGTWWVGKGEVFRQDPLVAVREGGLMYLPAKLAHSDVAGSGDGDPANHRRRAGQGNARRIGCCRHAVRQRRSISRGHAGRRRPETPLRVGRSRREQSGPRQSGPVRGTQ